MENNKYYIPQIEEFCVGFEFEFLNNTEWEKHNFMCVSQFTFDDLPELAMLSRVKYLDYDDILELGFTREFSTRSEILDSSCEVYISEEKNLMLGHYPNLNKVTIATRDFSKSNKLLKTNWDERQVNLITIKNKKELQKLLKQLEND